MESESPNWHDDTRSHPSPATVRMRRGLVVTVPPTIAYLPAGGMFWFIRKKFVGSHLALIAASRSKLAP